MGAGSIVTYQGVSARNEFFDISANRFLVEAGSGNDYVYSDFLDDILFGQGGRDLLRGEGGNDQLFGDFSADDFGNPRDGGADLLAGGFGDDSIYGSVGNDFLCGEAGNDRIDGGSDNDLIYGGSGSDTIWGGTGNDTIWGSSEAATNISFWPAISCDFDGKTDQPLPQTLVAGAGGNYIEVAPNDTAPDTIDGGDGNDVIYGSLGADTLKGGRGNDTFYVNLATDKVVEAAGEGSDVVSASSSYTLGAGVAVEILRVRNPASTVAQNLAGNEFAQTLVGGDAVNGLFGRAGNDTLTGGKANDNFYFDRALSATTNVDHITDFANAAGNNDTIRLDDAIFTGLATGALNPNLFKANSTGAATEPDDRIVYNTSNGHLSFDTNGNTSGGATLFAIIDSFASLTGAAALSASDFNVY